MLSLISNIFGALQLEINRIHIRYEDDYFNNHRPFSLGLAIEKIQLRNHVTHWTFKTSTGMHFDRTANDYVNKEFDIVRLRVYVNSLSETIIPHSLVEATKTEEYKIFSAMDASLVRMQMIL